MEIKMRMNNVFTCLNEMKNENQSGGPLLKLGMIIRILIPISEGSENESCSLK